MFKSGIAYVLCFVVSLVVGHALIILFSAYVPTAFKVFVTLGEIFDNIFGMAYTHKEIAAFILGAILSFPFGILFHVFLKVGRW